MCSGVGPEGCLRCFLTPLVVLCMVKKWKWKSLSQGLYSPHGLYSPWNSPGQNTGMGVAVPFSRGSSQPRDWTQVYRIVGRWIPVWATAGKESACKVGRPGFDPCVGMIPWRREQLPTPVFCPGEFYGLYNPWGCKEADRTEQLSVTWSIHFKITGLVRRFSRRRDCPQAEYIVVI